MPYDTLSYVQWAGSKWPGRQTTLLTMYSIHWFKVDIDLHVLSLYFVKDKERGRDKVHFMVIQFMRSCATHTHGLNSFSLSLFSFLAQKNGKNLTKVDWQIRFNEIHLLWCFNTPIHMYSITLSSCLTYLWFS